MVQYLPMLSESTSNGKQLTGKSFLQAMNNLTDPEITDMDSILPRGKECRSRKPYAWLVEKNGPLQEQLKKL
jgi:hypothetical protein